MVIKDNTRLSALFVILLIILTACQSNLQEQILGQWKLGDENQNSALIFRFKEDGQITIWMEDIPIRGAYAWVDHQTIQITFEHNDMNGEILGKVEINGDRLKITNDQGETDTLVRMK
jgi:hypothetical protein